MESHSENKAGTAATYKSGFGCWPGVAGRNSAASVSPVAPAPITYACWTRFFVELVAAFAAAGGDPSTIGSVIFPRREKFGDSSTPG